MLTTRGGIQKDILNAAETGQVPDRLSFDSCENP